MKFKVHVIADAEQDIFEIYHYISASGSPLNAEKLLSEIEQTIKATGLKVGLLLNFGCKTLLGFICQNLIDQLG